MTEPRARLQLPASVSPAELARYAVALANAQGGVLQVGAEDGNDTAELHPLQLTHAVFKLSGERLTVNVRRGEAGGLEVHVPQAPYLLSTPEGEVLTWDGEALRPLSPEGGGVSAPDVTARVPPSANLSDLDPLEVARLRGMARSGGLSELADLDFLQELGLIEGGQPTVAGLLLAGTRSALRRHLPQAEVCYYWHNSGDAEFQFREDLLAPIPATLGRLQDLIQARNAFTPVQVGLFRIEVWDFDAAVYREAILNALAHRDYSSPDAVHLHHHPDRLDIMNPGSFPSGITPGNVLRHQPKRRNPLLAGALQRLGLVERAGVGVDKMYSALLRCGKEPPEYAVYDDALALSLHNPGFDADFVRFVARKQEEMQTLSLDMLIVLSRLARESEAARGELARALQLPEDRTPRLLTLMEERGLIVHAGSGAGRMYRLSDDARAHLGRRGAPAPVTATPKAPTLEDAALQLATQPGGVSNALLREGFGLSSQAAWRLLRRLTLAGKLTKVGDRGKGVHYLPAEGSAVSPPQY